MKILSALIKVRLAALFATLTKGKKMPDQRKSGSKGAMIALWTFISVMFMISFFTMFMGMGLSYFEIGLDWLYFAMYGMMSFALLFLGSVFMTETQIFEASDNDMLLSMPIPSPYILASRMASLAVMNYYYELIIAVPAFVGFCIWGSVTLSKVVIFILLTLTLPLFAMAVTMLFAFLLSAATSRMKNKTIFKMVLSIAFLSVYFVFCFGSSRYMTALFENGEKISNALGGVFLIYWFGAALTEGDFLMMLFSILVYLASFALAYFILSITFVKITTSNRGAAKVVYSEKKTKNKGADSALVRRELARFFSSVPYMLNCGMGLLFVIGLSVYAAIKSSTLIDTFGGLTANLEINIKYLTPEAIAPLLSFVISGINMLVLVSAPSVSLEGKNLWIAQSLPVDGSRVLIAKAKTHFIVTAPVMMISSAVITAVFPISVLGVIATFLEPLAMCAFVGVLGVAINARFPRFDWTDETVAVKQGSSIVITMGISFGAFIIPAVPVVASMLVMPVAIAAIVYACVLLLVSALILSGIKKNGGKRFASFTN